MEEKVIKKDLVDKMLEAFEREWTFDKTSNRTAMKAAVRVFTDVPFEELGINEEDEEDVEDLLHELIAKSRYEGLDAVIKCHEETKETLTRIEEKLDRIIAHLETKKLT